MGGKLEEVGDPDSAQRNSYCQQRRHTFRPVSSIDTVPRRVVPCGKIVDAPVVMMLTTACPASVTKPTLMFAAARGIPLNTSSTARLVPGTWFVLTSSIQFACRVADGNCSFPREATKACLGMLHSGISRTSHIHRKTFPFDIHEIPLCAAKIVLE
jgi:hypothetical protein